MNRDGSAWRAVIGTDPGNCTGIGIGIDQELLFAYAATPGDPLRLPPELFTASRRAELGLQMTIETPVIYPKRRGGKGTRNPAAIVTLSITAGRWIERASQIGARVVRVEPRTWKGTVDGDAFVERIRDRLTPRERLIVEALALPKTKVHNVYDGVGLFLWTVGRLGKKWSV